MNARAEIASIDRDINAVRADLIKRLGSRPSSAVDWQLGWNRWPVLQQKHRELFLRRGQAQLRRDIAETEAAMKAARSQRLKKAKCPTCGATSLQVAGAA